MAEEKLFRALVFLREYSKTERTRTPDMIYFCDGVDTDGGALRVDISKDEAVIIPLDLVEKVRIKRNRQNER